MLLALVHLRREIGTTAEAAAGDVDAVEHASVSVQLGAQEAAIRAFVAQYHRRGPIAEEHGQATVSRPSVVGLARHLAVALSEEHVPVFPGHEACVRVGANQEHRLGGAGLDQAVRDLHPEGHRRALLTDVECGDPRDPELRPQEPAGAGKHILGSHRREHDEVDVFGRDPCVGQRAMAGLDREVADAFPFFDEVPLPDPGPWPDPFVAGVHDAGERVVRDGNTWDVMPGTDDGDGHLRRVPEPGRAVTAP